MSFKNYWAVLGTESRLAWDILLPCEWCTLIFGVCEQVMACDVAYLILGEHPNVGPL